MIAMIFPCFFSTAGVTFLLLQQAKDRKLKLLNKSFAKKESEYSQLKRQVNPHFFFNNLSMLLSFIESDPKKAVEFGQRLSNVYRKFLKTDDEDFVQLSHEMNFIYEYIEIYRAKFGQSFILAVELKLYSDHDYILADALQEIIDNIFKHNIFEDDEPMTIEIFNADKNLIVRNSTRPKLGVASGGTGLENIRKRYELLTGQVFSASKTDDVFVVNLPILESE
ncbi:MAG: hypothetical protein EOP06_16840 [Proteobacteria bacterium]|nr:MAG: hypothetical protein EOP06_16840 [Pseudomonadota bacterium]